MVSTRNHPQAFPDPSTPSTPSNPRSTPPRNSKSSQKWTHTPSNLTLIWLLISLPLVVWDTGYVLLRPHTMPGGSLHWPLWTPYELYGRVDYIYGWKAYNEHNGFTAAQGMLNVVETLFYAYYGWVVYTYGKPLKGKGKGAPSSGVLGRLGEARSVGGKVGATAVLIAFSASVMTVSKTVLYWLNEYFSGFENIGHNKIWDLIFLWIIPNGAWLVVPSYMIYVFGAEIIEGLDVASGSASETVTLAIKDE